MDSPGKYVVDAAAASGTFAALVGYLPSVVTLLTGVWVLIRIYESNTVQTWLGKKNEPRDRGDS